MATPKRYNILQAVIAALKTITVANGYNTTVAYVSDDLDIDHPDQLDKNKFPACFPYDAEETKEPLAIFGGPGDNMQSTLTIIITCMIYSRIKSQNIAKRADMMQDVERVMVTNTDLSALLLELPDPKMIVTDKGFFGNYSVWDQTFHMTYTYVHSTGG